MTWWQEGVIYQIYPRSFQDTNGDGIGDINGIIQRLDYLKWLGVNALWLSPVFPSPMADFGYDVSDYTSIHPLFGTMDDFDRLVAESHARDLKVIMDFVPNHTSDQHQWFQESRMSRDNPRRDWYIWQDARPDGNPPNNWLSEFGGSAWKWDADTQQYYLHSFLPSQPDLNFRNPAVVQAILDAMRFWLNRGVDGFRVDVINYMLKDEHLRDDPLNPDYTEGDNPWESLLHVHSANQPEVLDIIRHIRLLVDEYDNHVLIGEIDYFQPIEEIVAFYGDGDAIHLPFNFWLITLPWEASAIREFVEQYDDATQPHFPNYVLGNHDRPRVATRVGLDQARIAAMLLLTLRGTPFIYYGDELGMRDVPVPVEQIQDPWGINMPGASRDPARTPMQWDERTYAGFSETSPWLPIASNYATENVAVQKQDATSMLNLYHQLLVLRRAESALQIGEYAIVEQENDTCFVYTRTHEGKTLLVALNFSDGAQSLTLVDYTDGRLLLTTHLDKQGIVDLTKLHLRPHEGCIIEPL